MANISKISKIPIREEFPNEEHDFTPWLEKNLHYIEEELHLEFTDDVLTEVPVGPYSCDLLAETVDGKKVVIENMFGKADHDHLGKMLTYAAGLDADMLILIAEKFREEEIATLNWLNKITSDETPVFFALEIELIKIGNSDPALDINIVVQPDKWTKQVNSLRIARQATATAEKYHAFWNDFIEYFSIKRNELKNRTPPKTNYIDMPSKVKHFNFTFFFSTGKVPAILLWIGRNPKKENEVIFNKLKEHRHELESTLPNLIWENNPNNKSKRIIFPRGEGYNFSEDRQEDLFEWFVQAVQKFEKAFNPLLDEISV